MTLRKKSPDFLLFMATILLLVIGIVMVYSASQVTAHERLHDTYYYLKKQLLWASVGIGAMMLAMGIDYWKYKKMAIPFLVLAFSLLVMVLLPGIGKTVKGAQRWIGLGPFTIQPSEMVKLSLVIFMSYGLSVQKHKIKKFSQGLLPNLLILGLACGLILLQPDLGTAVSVAGTVFVMLFAAGAEARHLSALALAGIGAVGLAIAFEPYRLRRFLAFLDPWADPLGSGFHIIQSLYALGSGGLFGLGLGQSHQKFFYLPEQHTDFIFAVLGEELGFLGGSLVLLLFILFVWRGFRIALSSPDSFSSLLAVGITTMVALQAIINIGVVTGSMPVTGIPLPLISFGGSSLIFTLIGVGILLNISKYGSVR
ncbi:stage V sporulation protein E [Thermincola ferriacetica]|uniref:Probable peptidoglycan glycosyltransferase FtsW n=2 Tax=Thermincola TaxID=278993 RepID=D5X9A2_THEPJ|nr:MULTISPECIES: stage V sporulation protein E [Thermincola]ADG83006.1 stage V sporulation protein E [Thermincola potens JR]KNZ70472.1 stage V sporulation protein E [Thermincola ferriacetica]